MSQVLTFDPEMADRIAEKCASICCMIAFGPSSQALFGPITWMEAYERGFISIDPDSDMPIRMQIEMQMPFPKGNPSVIPWPPSVEHLITPEDDDGIGMGEVTAIIAVVLLSIASRRPQRVTGGRAARFFRFKLSKQNKERALKIAETVILGIRARAPGVVKFISGYLSSEAVEAAVNASVKVRGVNIPSRETWSQIMLGMRHAIVPIIASELIGQMLPQEPQSPREPSKSGVSRPGRRIKGPKPAAP